MAKKKFKVGGLLGMGIVFLVGIGAGYMGRNQIAKVLNKGKALSGARARTVGAYYAPGVRRR